MQRIDVYEDDDKNKINENIFEDENASENVVNIGEDENASIKEKYKTKKEIEARKNAIKKELEKVYLKEYYAEYVNDATYLGRLRDYLLRKDMREAYYKKGYLYAVVSDISALVVLGGGVLVFAPEYFDKYITISTALVAGHLALPVIYDKSKYAVDEKICELRYKLLSGKREKLGKKRADLNKELQALEK